MKVTVCFGDVRVIVPCGNGDLLVSELIAKAVSRYKKATGKPNDFYVNVHSLKSSSDGGILDHDDLLSDVADDREQIIALYEEQGGPIPHNGGDGTSASSAGTASPDIFQGQEREHKNFLKQDANRNDVVVTSDDLNTPSALTVLQVRRGSEPSLTEIGKDSPSNSQDVPVSQPAQKWPPSKRTESPKPASAPRKSESPEGRPRLKEFSRVADTDDEGSFSRLGRDSVHRSLTGSNMYNWLQAQAKTEQKYAEINRREPLGGSGLAQEDNKENHSSTATDDNVWCVTLKKEAGPLGIHVVPHYDDSGRDSGLQIQGIEPGGRIQRDGRFDPLDRIIEINGQSLMDVNFNEAQEIFRDALQTDELSLKIVKAATSPTSTKPVTKKPPPVLPKPTLAKADGQQTKESIPSRDNNQLLDKPPSPTKKERPESLKIPPAPPVRNPNTQLSTPVKITAPTNTRRLGKLVDIQLTKGPQGLGFSITTRDNPASADCPIYIKNILPKGAAITDGRLKSGDRLLEVNGIEMTGKSQAEAVAILRNTKLGSVVNLVVSRQEAGSSQFSVPREMPAEKTGDDAQVATPTNKEVLTFNIPLNETGSAGLGVSVKGKTRSTPHGPQDLGIFIKAVITGGAASKDGRLQINDQLIQVNGESLLGKMNSEAMEQLRNSMQVEGPMPGYINLVVARKIGPPSPSHTPEPSGAENLDQSVMSEYFGNAGDDDSGSSEESNTEEAENAKNSLYHKTPIDSQIKNPILAHLQSTDRNDSYQYATKEDFSPDQSLKDQRLGQGDGQDALATTKGAKNMQSGYGTYSSPTLNARSDTTVMIDDVAIPSKKKTSSSHDPNSVPGLLSDQKDGNQEDDTSAPKPPSWLVEWDKNRDNGEADEEPEGTFTREGFGRQSFSEKRRHLEKKRDDEIVMQAKKVREELQVNSLGRPKRAKKARVRGHVSPRGHLVRSGSAESLVGHSLLDRLHDETSDIGPTLGMKKSSSLESLQTMVKETVGVPEEKKLHKPPNRVARGRGCNESFRTAVDRSYEPAQMELTMEASKQSTPSVKKMEEESSESGRGQSSRQSSFSNGSITEEQSKKVTNKKKKKKNGLFGGIGHVFRFGKHRKPLDERAPKVPQVIQQQETEKQQEEQLEKFQARKAAQEEQERIQEQYRKLQERQRQMDSQAAQQVAPGNNPYGNYMQLPAKQQRVPQYEPQQRYELRHAYEQERNLEELQHYDRLRSYEQQRSYEPSNRDYEQFGSYGLEPPQSRAERIQQLRSQHQKRHRERQGQYPGEERDEHYEQALRQREMVQRPFKGHRYSGVDYEVQVPLRPKQDNYERPDSSARLSYPASREIYSHYQNSNEIQDVMLRQDVYQDRHQRSREQQRRHNHRPLPQEPHYHPNTDFSNRGRTTPSSHAGHYSVHSRSAGYPSDSQHGPVNDYNDYDDPRKAYMDNHSIYATVQKKTKDRNVNRPAPV